MLEYNFSLLEKNLDKINGELGSSSREIESSVKQFSNPNVVDGHVSDT